MRLNTKLTAIIAIVAMTFSTTTFAKNYVIGTGSQSGTYYPLGGALAKVWSENIKDFNMKVEVTAASVENTVKVNKGNQLVGIAMGDTVLNAYSGIAPFKSKLNVEVLFALYPNVVQFMVPANSDIKTIYDLKGKKVSLGAPGSGTRVGATAILNALGIKETDMDAQNLNYTATTNAIANKQIDAGVIIGSLGVGAITEVALTSKISIISFSKEDLEKITKAIPSYQGMDFPEGAYNNVPAFSAPAVWNVLVVNKKIDEKLAYEMTKVAYEHMSDIEKTLKIVEYTTPENATKLNGVPLSAGSIKYLKEMVNISKYIIFYSTYL